MTRKARPSNRKHKKYRTYDRAGIGEVGSTMLYPILKTPVVDMGDFGVGVGLYFTTLKWFAIMLFFAGIINIPNLMFFNSTDYQSIGRSDIKGILRVSAVCSDTTWQPCPDCIKDDWDRFPASSDDRFAFGQAADGSDINFIKVNNCQLKNSYGTATLVCFLFTLFAVYAINLYQKRIEAVQIDEAQQTSTDYSIVVKVDLI